MAEDMTVAQVKEALDDFGDHVIVKVVKDGRNQDTFFTPVQIGHREMAGGEIIVQIEIDQAD